MKLIICGDYCDKSRVGQYLLEKKDYSPFAAFEELISSADLAVVNLENPIADSPRTKPIAKTGPNLKGMPQSVDLLIKSGFNLFTLANNHMMDYGVEGLKSTLRLCANRVAAIGAGMNKEEASSPFYFEKDGRRYAIVNACENEWSTTQGNAPGCCPLDEITLWHLVSEARKNADSVVVILHGGHEGYEWPSPRMTRLYRWIIDLGADAVITHHTHCFCGHEIYKGKPIVYSLGNLLFDSKQQDSKWNYGAIAQLDFDETGNVELTLHPYKQCLDEPIVQPLTGGHLRQWQNDAAEKSALISGKPEEIRLLFDDFCAKAIASSTDFLEPLQHRLIASARAHGLWPRFLTKKQKRLLLNIIRDEAHRDKIINILEKIYDKNRNC